MWAYISIFTCESVFMHWGEFHLLRSQQSLWSFFQRFDLRPRENDYSDTKSTHTHTMFCSCDAGSVSGTSLISHMWLEVDWKSILQRSSSSTPLGLHTATSGFLVRSAATSGHAPPIPPPLSEVKGRSSSGRAAGPLLLKTSLPFIS